MYGTEPHRNETTPEAQTKNVPWLRFRGGHERGTEQ